MVSLVFGTLSDRWSYRCNSDICNRCGLQAQHGSLPDGSGSPLSSIDNVYNWLFPFVTSCGGMFNIHIPWRISWDLVRYLFAVVVVRTKNTG